MKSVLLVFFLIAFSTTVEAASGGHGGVPMIVAWQALNFTLFIALLYFLLRKKVRTFFAGRVETFQAKALQAKKDKETAESAKKSLVEKINELNQTEGEQIQRAEKEAELLKTKILKDADAQVAQIQKDTVLTVENEYQKAKGDVTREFLDKVLSGAKTQIGKDLSPEKQKDLGDEFLTKIRVVH